VNFYARTENFGAIIFSPRLGQYVELGHDDLERLKVICSGHEPLSEVEREQLGPILGKLAVGEKPQMIPINNPRVYPTALSAPFKAFFNLTKRCNLFCAHCFNDSGYRSSPELPFEQITRVLDELQAKGIFMVTFAGGEPLAHPNIYEVLHHLCGSDLRVSIITNGILIDDRMAECIANTPNVVSVTVSLDGADAKSNDFVRGRGAFQKAVSGIRRLKPYFTGKTVVRLTIMRSNISTLMSLPELLTLLGINELKVNRINPYGRASVRNDLLLSENEYKLARSELFGAVSRQGIRMEVPSFKYQVEQNGEIGLCRAGVESFEIDGDGKVYPCSFSFGRFCAGDIQLDSFDSILEELQLHTINNEFCLSCRGRGGQGEKAMGFVPSLVERRLVQKEPH
jgi:MoaA/NifB/PqqE/SkfB family radical SAM enzyme